MASPSKFHRAVQRIYHGGLKVLALSTVAAVGVVWYDFKTAREVDKDSPEQTKTKKVLVVPFHRMKLVEQKGKFNLGQQVASFSDDEDDDGKIIEVEVKQLVDTIHAAAADPNIVALYGKFGHGFQFAAGGWAHVEEVRNALRVFKESHRVHWEPNSSHSATPPRRGNVAAKPMFAYADTFANPMDPANKEYYLASVFPCIHMQAQGELHLLGFSMSYPFLRGALDKYGIKVHVFKHGKYKNAPNMFTEKGYVKDHLENTKSLVEDVDDLLCEGIVNSRRGLEGFDSHLWTMLHEYGTFSGERAHTVGLVDYLPRREPLESLLESNKSDEAKKAVEKTWGAETAVDKFHGEEAVSWSKYSAIVQKRKSLEQRKLRTYARLRSLSEKYVYVDSILSMLGLPWPYCNIKEEDYVPGMSNATKERIALVHIGGTITDNVARRTVNSLRRIKKDKKTKCVVLRVDSPGGSATAAETILQEVRDTPMPVVCSMGNIAASAGYYIASNCDKIYALPTTFTGSIGVFGVKMDLTDMAKQYGVKVEHVVAGPLSSSNSPFQPMTKPIQKNFARSVDRIYECFKSHVATGRDMSLESVEEVAQGRVFTGEQARDAGLVDELGDLTRVIGYANRTYTSGYAQVEVWPKQASFGERIRKLSSNDETEPSKSEIVGQLFIEAVSSVFGESNVNHHANPRGDTDMTRYLVSVLVGQPGMFDGSRAFPSAISGIMMTADENSAMRCLLEQQSAEKPLLPASFWQ